MSTFSKPSEPTLPRNCSRHYVLRRGGRGDFNVRRIGIKTVRVPKRYDGRARGFAFVEFERAADALNARRALGAAHLYGRHLVIDWADGEDERAGVK